MLELYQIQDCSYCRRVRSRLDELGLDYLVRNEPQDLARRERVFKISGQRRVPTLVDPERSVIIANDDQAIIEYLEREYGPGSTRGGGEKSEGDGPDVCIIGGGPERQKR